MSDIAFTTTPPDEIERKRVQSVDEIHRQAHQQRCDTLYWANGPCCAGCDHWRGSHGDAGQCVAAGIMSGDDVMRSLGLDYSSYKFAPDFPYTDINHHCGLFKDDFDWGSLEPEYLAKIGAMSDGKLKGKPQVAGCKQ